MILIDAVSAYPYILATHIIFIVTWFAALFYIVRLFIYHVEATQKPEPEKSILTNQFSIMERRLMNIIGTPSMILVLITGSILLSINNQFLAQGWMQFKLFFVVCLIFYHTYCLKMLHKLKTTSSTPSSQKLRMINELATIFLVAIVFLVELKNLLDMVWALCGIIVLMIVLFIAIKIYKIRRQK